MVDQDGGAARMLGETVFGNRQMLTGHTPSEFKRGDRVQFLSLWDGGRIEGTVQSVGTYAIYIKDDDGNNHMLGGWSNVHLANLRPGLYR